MMKSPQQRRAKLVPQAAEQSAEAEPNRDSPLNFKVSAEFRREFKTYAAQHNKKLYQLLYESFASLKAKHAD